MGCIQGCEDKGFWLLDSCDWLLVTCIWLQDPVTNNQQLFSNKFLNTDGEQPATFLTFAAQKQIRTMSNRTLTMIKPDAMKKGYAGGVLDMMIQGGFRVVALKQLQLTPEKAGEFYAVHKERPFYGELVEFMSSGPIIAAILEKENAVADFRKLIGATNPANAEEGTIRKKYASSVGENAVHGSDSDENAKIEGDFFFSALERF